MRSKYKIVFLGNQNVGKTTLISQYVYQQADDKYNPTIGIDFLSTKLTLLNKEVSLQLWDTAGQERFNSIIPSYTRDCFISVIVYDINNLDSFNNIDHWVNNLVKINESNKNVKIIIVGNKKDNCTENLVELVEKGNEKAKELGGVFVLTCAMCYQDIEELVRTINALIEEDIKACENIIDLGRNVHDIKISAKRKFCC
ncbi:Ras- protein Rab-6B [Gurleya vavrai]